MQLNVKMYKIIWCFIFFSFLISNTKTQQIVSRAIATCGSNESGVKCRDYSTLMYCNRGQEVAIVPCSQQYPGRHYCNSVNNTCVESLQSCSLKSCPGPGIFPNPSDCSTYYYCKNNSSVAELRSCLFNSVYDLRFRRCITDYPCLNLTKECNGSYKILPYSLDKLWYIVCMGPEQPLILNCPNFYHPFNPSSLVCEFRCPYQGFFRNRYNPQNYYTCIYINGRMVYEENSCGNGKEFDEEYSVCRNSSLPNSKISTFTNSP